MPMKLEDFDARPLDLLIEYLGLHQSYPVNLEPLFQSLEIRVQGAAQIPGKLEGASAMQEGRGVIVYDVTLDPFRKLCVMAHETGHILKHLDGQFRPKNGSPQAKKRLEWLDTWRDNWGNHVPLPTDEDEEREADVIGAYLVVPLGPALQLIEQGLEKNEIATRLGVTTEYLEIRVALMLARNELS